MSNQPDAFDFTIDSAAPGATGTFTSTKDDDTGIGSAAAFLVWVIGFTALAIAPAVVIATWGRLL